MNLLLNKNDKLDKQMALTEQGISNQKQTQALEKIEIPLPSILINYNNQTRTVDNEMISILVEMGKNK